MRVGIVGLGWAAVSFHAPALKQIQSVQLVGGADSAADRRDAWQKATGTTAFGSLDELLENGSLDVLVVATPPNSHAELCLRALDAGAHVLCEKPFVSTIAEADRCD